MSDYRETDILLVEDNPSDLKLALHSFKQHGFAHRVEIARDGAEALDFIFGTGPYAGRPRVKAPRVILLDLQLPKVSGLEVLKRLKSDPQTRSIPVVILTSSRENRDLTEAYRLGANSYIVKPVDFEQFTKCVQEIGVYWLVSNTAAGADAA